METVTIFRSSYESLLANEFKYMTEHAKLKGKIIALADIIKTNPDYVKGILTELAAEFKGETA